MRDGDSEAPARPEAGEREQGMSPVRAFLLLSAVAAAVAIGVFAARDEAAPSEPPRAARTPDYSLTDGEAIAEFERLNDQLLLAYRERNIALAEDVLTADSPMLPRVRSEIRTLIRSATFSRTTFDPLSTSVIENEPTVIKVSREEVLRPRFETETGEEATASGRSHRQKLEWTLHLDHGAWRLHDAVIVAVDDLEDRTRR